MKPRNLRPDQAMTLAVVTIEQRLYNTSGYLATHLWDVDSIPSVQVTFQCAQEIAPMNMWINKSENEGSFCFVYKDPSMLFEWLTVATEEELQNLAERNQKEIFSHE